MRPSRPGILPILAVLATATLAGCERPIENGDTGQTTATAGTGAATAAPGSTDAEVVDSGPPRLTAEGWGPLRIGMTRAEVVAAAGDDANPELVGGPEPEACDEWRPTDAPAGMIVMLVEGRLARITLVRGTNVVTAAGFGPGDSASTVEAAHPNATVTPHKYQEAPASYITVWESGPDTAEPRGIVYETGTEGVVTHVHAGGTPIQWVEGCL